MNHYSVDSLVCFINTHPMDSDLYHGWCYPPLEQLATVYNIIGNNMAVTVFGECKKSAMKEEPFQREFLILIINHFYKLSFLLSFVTCVCFIMLFDIIY